MCVCVCVLCLFFELLLSFPYFLSLSLSLSSLSFHVCVLTALTLSLCTRQVMPERGWTSPHERNYLIDLGPVEEESPTTMTSATSSGSTPRPRSSSSGVLHFCIFLFRFVVSVYSYPTYDMIAIHLT